MSIKTSEEINSFYLEEACTRADDIYRVAILLTLNEKSAHECVDRTFSKIAKEIADSQLNIDHIFLKMAEYSYQESQTASNQKTADEIMIINKIKDMPLESRLSLAFIDILGLTRQDAISILQWDEKKLAENLAKGRKELSNLTF